MARVVGIDLPKFKRGVIGLTYIYGIGKSRAKDVLTRAGVDLSKKVRDWNDDELNHIRAAVGEYTLEGELQIGSTNKHQAFDGYWLLPRYSSP